jgi:EAL domain-containing protein (putative c-di-GMP-specific phosphodiesterase class I)
LLRLQQEDGQWVMPGDFIGHAEEIELTGKIDRWVLKKAVRKLIEFNRLGKEYKLAINLSGRLFSDATIYEDIARLLATPEVDPGKLILEVTETAAVSNFAAAEELLLRIKALGCQLALDDFGVGFSSFYYLKHFPVDYVKIDGSIIRRIHKSEDDKVFVKALSGVAQAFGKKTVAEFVENAEILAVLKEFEIDYAQGYYIGKPERLN